MSNQDFNNNDESMSTADMMKLFGLKEDGAVEAKPDEMEPNGEGEGLDLMDVLAQAMLRQMGEQYTEQLAIHYSNDPNLEFFNVLHIYPLNKLVSMYSPEMRIGKFVLYNTERMTRRVFEPMAAVKFVGAMELSATNVYVDGSVVLGFLPGSGKCGRVVGIEEELILKIEQAKDGSL